MDTRKTLSQSQALNLAREYKRVITPRFKSEPKVYLYGSYSKGCPNPDSDIDVAVILPHIKDDEWLETSADLVHDGWKVNNLIEPVLMEENEDSILYHDIMRTGIAI